jgi:hypothetical protein
MLGPYQRRTDERKPSSNMAVLSWERQPGVDHLKLTFETQKWTLRNDIVIFIYHGQWPKTPHHSPRLSQHS